MTNGEKFKSVFGFGADGSRVIAVNSTWWDCDFQIRKPKTNADRIRSMSDEELAGFLFEYGGSAPNCKDEIVSNCKSCRDCWLDWLKQEAKE